MSIEIIKFLDVSNTQFLVSASPYSSSLNDCYSLATQFRSTCDSTSTPLSSITSHAGRDMACVGTSRCPDQDGQQTYTEDSPCEYKSKLCVTCQEDDDGDVYIRVQSNTMPDHCQQATNANPETMDVDWKVRWNVDVADDIFYPVSDIDSQNETDEILCDIQRTSQSNLAAKYNYEQFYPTNANSLNTAGGWALSGATIFNALSGAELDAVEEEWETLDQCLSHPSPFGYFHYHNWSPCINPEYAAQFETTFPDMCSDTNDCSSDPLEFGIDKGFTSTANWGGMVGIAKDGHPIYGPYNADGELWTCDEHDICNGRFFDNGSYGYVSTATHPYVIGCWGPGAQQIYDQSCSGLLTCPGTHLGATQIAASISLIATVFSAILF